VQYGSVAEYCRNKREKLARSARNGCGKTAQLPTSQISAQQTSVLCPILGDGDAANLPFGFIIAFDL